MNDPSRNVAYAALVLTVALWASSAVAARGLLNVIPPVTLSLLRWTVVALCLLPFAWRERAAMIKAMRTDFRTYAVIALIGFAPQTCAVYFGLAGSTATTLGLFNSAIPVIIVAVLVLFRGRKLHRLEAVGLGLSSLGVALILGRGDLLSLLSLSFAPSDLMLLATTALWALYTIRLSERPTSLSLTAFLFVCTMLGLLFLAPFATAEIAFKGWPAISPSTALGILYIGTLPTLIASFLFAFGLARVGAIHAGILTHLMPVFTALFAAVFLGERLQPFHGAGFLLVAGGALICCLRAAPVLTSRAPTRAPAKP
ncbi:MAG TPA: DMT family transporter [Casimicrobiaceae bacterium]